MTKSASELAIGEIDPHDRSHQAVAGAIRDLFHRLAGDVGRGMGSARRTGPEALSVAEAAAIIGDETGQRIRHVDLDGEAWIAGAIASGIPPEYEAVLLQLTETIANGHGSRPNGTVEKITGTPPHTFRNFAHHNANAWKEAK